MKRLPLVLSIVAVVIAIAAVVLAILLPGSQGPIGPQGPTGATGAQGPEGPAWTPSVVQLEWTIEANWDNKETIYLDEGDILEGSVSTAQPLGPVGPYKWSLSIFDLVVGDIVRMYPAGYTIDFRYVAQSSGKHEIWVFNEQSVAADVALDYWIIKPGEGTSYAENYELTTIVNPPEAGLVSPSSGEYESGDQVTLIAEPNSGYKFDYWSGSTSGTSATITITMDSDKSITANFEPVPTGISWDEAKNHIGEWATESTPVYGLVAGASYRPDISGQPTWLNIGEDYPSQDRFVVIIWGDNRGNFSQAPEDYYLGKTICVTGLITEYEGVAQIEATSSDQIDEC